jgi:pyruvate,water dikinase
VVEDHAEVFACLLGLLNGRVYYNMLNGYRILTLLPGYKLNRRFTEEMLGFRETLPEEIEVEMEAAAVGAKGRDLLQLMRTLWGVMLNFIRIEHRIDAFYERLHRVLPQEPRDLAEASPDELVKLYRYLETELLHRWDAPTINDFFAAIFHGTLRRLTSRWLADETGSLHNDLLCGDRELVSMEIADLVQKMARLTAEHPQLIEAMEHATRVQIESELEDYPELEQLYHRYLLRFGDRCLDELKLESSTIRDDPSPLFRSIAGYARHIRESGREEASIEQQILQNAESAMHQALVGHPLRRWTFGWVLEQTRRRVRCRENLRYERTRAFGMARRIGVEMGRRLHALGQIDAPRDIFYLTIDEMLAIVDGAAVTMNLSALVDLRRQEFERFLTMPAPAERFLTRGIPYVGDQFDAPLAASPIRGGETLTGVGCCPGIVRGPILVVEDPRDAVIPAGTIIVARRTDPGWVMVFPAAAGLLVERGSMLSHSAIVAREMGLPTIVSIPGLVGSLADGDCVEMDGATGTVTRVEAAS